MYTEAVELSYELRSARFSSSGLELEPLLNARDSRNTTIHIRKIQASKNMINRTALITLYIIAYTSILCNYHTVAWHSYLQYSVVERSAFLQTSSLIFRVSAALV